MPAIVQREVNMATVIKSVFLVQAFVAGLFITDEIATGSEAIILSVVNLVAMPLMLMLLIRLNVAFGVIAPPWQAPSWSTNPLSIENPLPFIHFCCFYFGAFGIGSVISVAWRGVDALGSALIAICGAAGLYVGLRWVLASFPNNEQGRNGND